jgi:hypothetical protein
MRIDARLVVLFLLLGTDVASAQHMHHAPPAPADSAAHADEGAMAGMDMGDMPMTGLYGPYPMSREASGTAWQPDAARREGVHLMTGSWMVMLHGYADVVYDDQGGPRGDTKAYGDNMGMAMASRALGPGTLGLRAMLSLEPATIGTTGYPLLLQTGETADGITPLIDRQHPHDLFMELAASYRVSKFFLYGGLPGEPALGRPRSAPLLGHEPADCPDHASLARLHAHHLWRPDGAPCSAG